MSAISDLHTSSQRSLAEHFETCPAGCKPNHVTCSWGWELIGREHGLWLAASVEITAARIDEPNPAPSPATGSAGR